MNTQCPNKASVAIQETIDTLVSEIRDSFFHDNNGVIVTFEELSNPDNCGDRCWPASTAFLGRLGALLEENGMEGRISGVSSPVGYHYAILVSFKGKREEGEAVIDFTARQFDKDAPFPLIASDYGWELWVEEMMGREVRWVDDPSYP